jgi:hypothetical protein
MEEWHNPRHLVIMYRQSLGCIRTQGQRFENRINLHMDNINRLGYLQEVPPRPCNTMNLQHSQDLMGTKNMIDKYADMFGLYRPVQLGHCDKTCLVANDFKQRYGLDGEETFSHVVKPVTVWLLMSLSLSRGWHLHHGDIENAFLNGFLDEKVNMGQPLVSLIVNTPDHYCQVSKFLYGLKQAPCAWHANLSIVLGSPGFSPSALYTSLFIL